MSLFQTIQLSKPLNPTYIINEENKLGEGTSGMVYKGKRNNRSPENFSLDPKRLKKTASFAIKVFKNSKAGMDESENTKEFSELHIPHMIRYVAHQFCSKPQRVELILDLIPGRTLSQIRSSLKWEDIRTISEQAFEFLLSTHRKELIHGDLKPENMLYEPSARYLTVIDCGLAARTSINPVLESNVPYQTIQSLYFRAPEIFLGMGHTSRTDLWSLGIIIYMLVTNRHFVQLNDYHKLDPDQQLKSRINSLQNLFSKIDLPSTAAALKIKHLSACPWIVKNAVVEWKESFEAPACTPWEELFKTEALKKGAPEQDINLFASILNKIFRFEDRASIEEVSQEYKASKLGDMSLVVTGLGNNQKLIIRSDQISVVFDNSLSIYRSCLHIPQNSLGKYTFTLIENEKMLIDERPFRLNDCLDWEINIPDLFKAFNPQ